MKLKSKKKREENRRKSFKSETEPGVFRKIELRRDLEIDGKNLNVVFSRFCQHREKKSMCSHPIDMTMV